jgi:immune inhibitor A
LDLVGVLTEANGDLTGDVSFTMGDGCGEFDYGYVDEGTTAPANTAPVADATAKPQLATVGNPVTLSATGSTDAETPNDLDFSWDFGNGDETKDAVGTVVQATYTKPGTYRAKVTVTDPEGLTDTAAVEVIVAREVHCNSTAIDRTGSWRTSAAGPRGVVSTATTSASSPDATP